MKVDNSQAIRVLCPQCGLCCNGILFADVRLQSGDFGDRLKELGLPIKKRGVSSGFSQPCAALRADGCCRVYADRPAMCRQFECGVLRQFTAGELSEPQALQLIRQARHQAARVTDLLRASGNHDEQEPLTKRYQAVMRQPIDLAAGEEAGEQRGELMLAVNGLMTLLQARFLSAGEKAGQP